MSGWLSMPFDAALTVGNLYWRLGSSIALAQAAWVTQWSASSLLAARPDPDRRLS